MQLTRTILRYLSIVGPQENDTVGAELLFHAKQSVDRGTE